MKIPFFRASVLLLALMALIVGAFWVLQNESGDSSAKQEPPYETISFKKAKEHYAISFEDARKLVRQPFGTVEEEAAAGLPPKSRELREGMLRDAVGLLGRVSTDRDDAMAIFANRRNGAKRYPPLHSRAVAGILARVAESEGKVMKMEPFMQEFWKPDPLIPESEGRRFIETIINEKPKGYHHTLAEWMEWLSADERLPKEPGVTLKTEYGTDVRALYEEVWALSEIIAVLEAHPEGTYKEAASRVTEKMNSLYKKSRYYDDFLKQLKYERDIAPDQVSSKPTRVSDVPKLK